MAITLNAAYLDGFVTKEDFSAAQANMKNACAFLSNGSGAGSDFLGWRDLPGDYDKAEFARIKKAAAKIRSDSDVLVVIGIGGSYLGARAVIELLGGQYFNTFSPLQVLYAGNSISGDALNAVLRQCEGKRVSLNLVSKSGTTTEPAIAFRVLRRMMEERYGKAEAAKRIYATTDKARGTCKQLADAAGYETFVIPDDIGGRYSVLTPVGLLPIAAAGFDIDALMAGAAQARADYANDRADNPSNVYAMARNILYNKGKTAETLSCFEPSFTLFAEWWKQLFGESEGKDKKGLMPTSVIFSTDLHSMGQFIQDGARMLFETFVSFGQAKNDLTVQTEADNFDGLNFVGGKTMSEVCRSAQNGTILAHVEGGVPCMVVGVPDRSEHSVGEMIYFFERSCAVSGYMLGINPFNQPGVESYKKNMFALLGKPGYESERENLLRKIK